MRDPLQGQKCSVCRKIYVVPRTEWLEWWSVEGEGGLPFLRRGCSWGCVPGGDGDVEFENNGDGEGEGEGEEGGRMEGFDVRGWTSKSKITALLGLS